MARQPPKKSAARRPARPRQTTAPIDRRRTRAIEARERLQAILQTAVEGIITIDHHGVIESANPAAERIFGHPSRDMIGQKVNMLMPAPFRQHHDTYIDNYLQTGHAKIIGIGREVLGLRKDGTIFPMDLSVSEIKLDNRRLFTGFVRDISERKSLEREILQISEMEQRRIGQDLHDGLCQQLAGIEFMSQALEQQLASTARTEAATAGRIAQLIREAISHTRDLAKGLSPVILEPEGLMSSLTLLAANVEQLFRIQCRFHLDQPVHLHDFSVATHLFRIAQEAVNNAIRHGEASRVDIHLTTTPERVILAVHDNGKGLPQPIPQGKGMGLRIMQYRAGMIGGSLAIQRDPQQGTSVVCSVHRQPNGPTAPGPSPAPAPTRKTSRHEPSKKSRRIPPHTQAPTQTRPPGPHPRSPRR